MDLEIEGMENLEGKLAALQEAEADFNAILEADYLPDGFIQKHTNYSDAEEFLNAAFAHYVENNF